MLEAMSCPKCAPQTRSKRWAWWAGVAVLLAAGAWLDRSRGEPAAPELAQPGR
jgi:hypothetical protein